MKMDVQETNNLRALPKLWQRRIVLVPVSLAAALLAWALVARWGDFPAFILPSPDLVWQRLLQVLIQA